MKAPVMPVDKSEHEKVVKKIEETGISFSDWSEVEPTQYTPAPASLMQLFSIPFLRGNMEFDTDLIAESCRELVGDIEDGDVGREYTTYFDEEVRTKMHETEWFKGQEKISKLPQDPDELVTANEMWKIEAGVKRYASDKEAHITNYDQIRNTATDLAGEQIKGLEKLNTLLDAILRLPTDHIEIKVSEPPF